MSDEHEHTYVGKHKDDPKVRKVGAFIAEVCTDPLAVITQTLAANYTHLDCATLILHNKDGRVASVVSTMASDTNGLSFELQAAALNAALRLVETQLVKS